MQLKLLYFCSAMILLSAVSAENLPWLGRFGSWVIDRSVRNSASPGFFALSIDRTAFAVHDRVWVEQIDISKVYLYDPVNEVPVEDVPTQVKLVEMFKPNDYEKVLFSEKISLNSTDEAKINLLHRTGEILLRPGYAYEIQLEFPKDKNLMYNDLHQIKEFSIRKIFNTYIHVDFFQNNPESKPPNEEDKSRKLSKGMVKRLHLKYKKF